MHGTDNIYWDGAADGHACIPIIIDIGEGGGDGKPFLRHGKVEHGTDGAKDPGNAAPGKSLLDQLIPEGIGVCLGVVRQRFISADVDYIAAGAVCSPVEGLRPAKSFQAQVCQHSLRERQSISGDILPVSRRRHGTGEAMAQKMLAGKVRVLGPQVIPVFVQLEGGTGRSCQGYRTRSGSQ
ncbi:hypothetical protein AB838_18675 [Rhodobacteraceae bacterium (ex Bugula neritina AB1)]|nr:hypothetical protein AB838_18675 [Rhodobacteraceae bacterium (ex Bugula neritina AB1)]